MKIESFINVVSIISLSSMGAFAYQAGPTSRPNFGNTTMQSSEVSQAQRGRTLNNYSSQQHNWSQGVQTQTVQTGLPVAKELTPLDNNVKDKPQVAPKAKPQKTAVDQKKVPENAKGNSSSTAPAKEGANAQNATQQNADPAAMLQQLQGMQDMMKGMSNMAGMMQQPTQQGTNASQAQNGAATMPAGMPDMSALMNMAGGMGNTNNSQVKK